MIIFQKVNCINCTVEPAHSGPEQSLKESLVSRLVINIIDLLMAMVIGILSPLFSVATCLYIVFCCSMVNRGGGGGGGL